MNAENVVSWLIHSDWYLVGGWAFLLGVAVILTFTNLPMTVLKPRNVRRDNLPPAP